MLTQLVRIGKRRPVKAALVVLLVLPLAYGALFTGKLSRPALLGGTNPNPQQEIQPEQILQLQGQARSQSVAGATDVANEEPTGTANDEETDPNAVTPADPNLSIAPTRVADVKKAQEEEAIFDKPDAQPEELQKKIFLGVVTKDPIAGSSSFEDRIGHKLSYVNWFQAWGDPDKDWNDPLVKTSIDRGYTPIITWEPWKRNFASPASVQPEFALSKIADGGFDAYIQDWADKAALYDEQIIIRFGHENTTSSQSPEWYPWQGDYANYKAAFRRVVTVFRDRGADNVKFMWSPLGHTASWTQASYPGGDVVDIVGTSILNFGEFPLYPWASWQPFDAVFKWEHDFIASNYGKPVIIAEVGTTSYGGDKTAWVKAMLNGLDEYSNLQGLLFLNTASDVSNNGLSWALTEQTQFDAFANAF